MTPKEFQIHLQQLSEEVSGFIQGDLRANVGKIAVDHFTENFQHEGFTDQGIEKWKEVKRRMNPRTRGARKARKILTGDTGDLGRSIKYDIGPGPGQVRINSDLPYATAHNEGTTNAGRSRSTTIPQSKFIGDSEKLDEKIRKEIENGLDKLLGKYIL